MSTDAVRAYETRRESNLARRRRVTEMRRSWVLDSEMTAEELAERGEQLRAECRARHPEWFQETKA